MSSTDRKPKTLLERLGDILIYIIAFPFIAVFIALKRVFTEQKQPSHSYRNRLPVMHSIGLDEADKDDYPRRKKM